MSSRIQIEPSGLFKYEWDGNLRKDVRSRVKRSKALGTLRRPCEIKDGTTLGDIFNVVDMYPRLRRFIAQYSWCPQIEEFHAQAREPTRTHPEGDPDPIDYLEIVQHGEVWENKSDRSFEISLDFHGIGWVRDQETFEERNDYPPPGDGVISWSVSLAPAYDLVDLPVKINQEFSVYRSNVKYGEDPLVLRADGRLSLLEVLDCIYYDLSFYGGPSDNAEFRDDLKDTIDKIESGEMEAFPVDLEEMMGDCGEDEDHE